MTINNVIGKYRANGRSWYQRNPNIITKITVHHTASKQKSGESHDSIMKKHMATHVNKKGWPGLAYHFMIMPDGAIYQINDYKDVTWHDGKNYESLGVCMEGYFHPDENEKPNVNQLASLKDLLDHLCTKHPEFPADHNDIRGHRDVMATACPGNFLYPYVVEYKEKLGNVSWGNSSDVGEFDLKKKLSDKNWGILTEFEKLKNAGLITRDDSIQTITMKWLEYHVGSTKRIADLEKKLIDNETKIQRIREIVVN